MDTPGPSSAPSSQALPLQEDDELNPPFSPGDLGVDELILPIFEGDLDFSDHQKHERHEVIALRNMNCEALVELVRPLPHPLPHPLSRADSPPFPPMCS